MINSDLFKQLYDIWNPRFGSLWRMQNRFFQATSFAKEKDPEAIHPGLVIDETGKNDSYQTAPGTSKYHSPNPDIFCTSLKNRDGKNVNAYFLLHFSIPIHKKSFHQICQSGWWGKDCLDDDQIEKLKKQLSVRKSYAAFS